MFFIADCAQAIVFLSFRVFLITGDNPDGDADDTRVVREETAKEDDVLHEIAEVRSIWNPISLPYHTILITLNYKTIY